MLADPAAIDEATIDLHDQNLKHARFDNRGISWSDKLLPYLGRLRCPLLLVYGDLDKTPHPSREARVARCRVVVPKLRLAVVRGAGHWTQYERPEAVEVVVDEVAGADVSVGENIGAQTAAMDQSPECALGGEPFQV